MCQIWCLKPESAFCVKEMAGKENGNREEAINDSTYMFIQLGTFLDTWNTIYLHFRVSVWLCSIAFSTLKSNIRSDITSTVGTQGELLALGDSDLAAARTGPQDPETAYGNRIYS